MAVDRDRELKRVGGRLCLDFVNTVGGRVPVTDGSACDYSVLRERFVDLDRLRTWARRSGLPCEIGPPRAEREATTKLRRALELREAIYRLFRSAIRDEPSATDDLETLSNELHLARRHERLVRLDDGGFDLRRAHDGDFVDTLLGSVAESALQLLTSEELSHVRECPGEECGWLFVDESRNRRPRCAGSASGTASGARASPVRHQAARAPRLNSSSPKWTRHPGASSARMP
jgi:predicted RNA-binding Zn ribbon-like protein